MPTIRSAFTIEQFETAFQKRAYQLALDAVQKLPAQPKSPYTNLQVTASGPKLEYVSTSEESIKFENGIYYSKSWRDGLSFTIEEKIYANSSHSCRISFYCNAEGVKETQSKIQAFIDELMAGIKPESRFSLKQLVPS